MTERTGPKGRSGILKGKQQANRLVPAMVHGVNINAIQKSDSRKVPRNLTTKSATKIIEKSCKKRSKKQQKTGEKRRRKSWQKSCKIWQKICRKKVEKSQENRENLKKIKVYRHFNFSVILPRHFFAVWGVKNLQNEKSKNRENWCFLAKIACFLHVFWLSKKVLKNCEKRGRKSWQKWWKNVSKKLHENRQKSLIKSRRKSSQKWWKNGK